MADNLMTKKEAISYKLEAERGFTLIELLVVISIISILASIMLISLNDARSKARDARRVADVRVIALSLEDYYDSNLAYPSSLLSLTPNFLSVVPVDPQTGSAYAYNSASCSPSNQRYVLGATLENTNSVVHNNDLDGTQCTVGCNDPVYCIMP